jgi:RNA exonuclease 1
MFTALFRDSQLIPVALVDYIAETVLINSIVKPDVPILHLNTKSSSVTWANIKNTRRQATIIGSKEGVREAIWKYVESQTFVIGHEACNDLRALKWIHV